MANQRVDKLWGSYEVLDAGYQVKRIMVDPGETLSLQGEDDIVRCEDRYGRGAHE